MEETAPIATVGLLGLDEMQEVSGVVDVRLETTGTSEVRYEVGGQVVAFRYDPPFDLRWNTRNTENGIRRLEVFAWGKTNSAYDEVTVIVNNVGAGARALILVEPTSGAVALGDTLGFSARVLGLSSRAVRWSVQGGESHGTIDATGLYTAPAVAPRPPKAVIVASSPEELGVAAEAEITLRSPEQ
ncbi:MAG: hypothetical protein R3E12_12395 [Candidatus Eisenbacteria bacterium]